jgi:hypothetical protein
MVMIPRLDWTIHSPEEPVGNTIPSGLAYVGIEQDICFIYLFIFEIGFCWVPLAGLELVILLPQPPEVVGL